MSSGKVIFSSQLAFPLMHLLQSLEMHFPSIFLKLQNFGL